MTLDQRLRDLHQTTVRTPTFNPVFQLGLDLSRDLESGAVSLSDIDAMLDDLEEKGLAHRADMLRARLAPMERADNIAAFTHLIDDEAQDFDAFARQWSHPIFHAVFTGHPTFLLTEAQSAAIAQAVTSGTLTAPPPAPPHAGVSLDDEHRQAMEAIHCAARARDEILFALYETAAAKWPDTWRDLLLQPFRFATWIGYDMDGRTDLNWPVNIHFRLDEKARRLRDYAMDARAADARDIADQLDAAASYSADMASHFIGPMTDPDELSAAANKLTAAHPSKLLSLRPIISQLQDRARSADDATARKLLVLASAMQADGLGMGWVHFRMNASQLHNALRIRLDQAHERDLASGTAMSVLRDLLAQTHPLRSNFAALAVETTAAVRQFMTMAQILHHIDEDTPIRLLIAECEKPQTVMAALYFAHLFGVADKVDISPLFETESALEHGERFLDTLLAEDAYRDYVRKRGRMAIQTGFSDAGRFVGQIPAALAIERLQGCLARAMADNGLQDISALIFNTHGESMGRGGYPGAMIDRLTWPMSRWARTQFASRDIALEPEASFQGGDGFLLFKTPDIALATLTRIAQANKAAAPDKETPDIFYERTDVSLDFYRAVRTAQHNFLGWRAYSRSLTAFGLNLLKTTGSRKSRRQFDASADRKMGLRQIRAIPHNAILQQLGYPINVLAGIGAATTGDDVDMIAAVMAQSERGRQIIGLLRAADRVSSIKTLNAYGELFSSFYWASRPYRGAETHLSEPCFALAEMLESDDRASEFRRLASRLNIDRMRRQRLLARTGGTVDEDPARETIRRTLGVLHSIRLALIQHIFLLAVQVPNFARTNDVSRDDVLNMIFALQIEDAVTQLRRAYPVSAPSLGDFDMAEPTDYPDQDGPGQTRRSYADIHSHYIDPIERAAQMMVRISTTIANIFGAFG